MSREENFVVSVSVMDEAYLGEDLEGRGVGWHRFRVWLAIGDDVFATDWLESPDGVWERA